ncbi:MAG: flagellar basal body rod protein FlgG [Gammaproteobacteria bacterium HGW-Gammaproteobacteria-4]|jgi:flagellar basal-body rod protein FlgG|nr:flagellar basal-body rod protein FlgG [Xanthomonadaceae bacterium]MDP2184556.1 flagellar basal-body rod protein FlgG [Xanthomonadales bacterium]PKM07689.1 MAG: flagellar basal body rod protein FlgG [Gammaproteobacteria bacterium HGW-Gammaproteobacteria-4]PKM15894.1 MAG: flagellar basal body rod protein FlgG [Gammaproteobacteria bacterium HGW-Gammaproteobacteria-2]MDZ4116361.1 flagellar basal-body rod protein FlgG [Xanthomonadaceae bacterium]
MFPALWIAKTGLDAQQTRMSVISNNLANVNTTGFKRSRAAFEDLLYQDLRQAGGQTSEQTEAPSGLAVGTGVRVVGTQKLFTQGNISQTNNPLDVAIQGRGFFEVLLPDGTQAYTRDGTLQIDSDGQVVTSSGYRVQPEITLPNNAQSVTIGSDGTIGVQIAGQAAPQQVGTLQIVDFINPSGLTPRGENLFLETAASGTPQPGTPGLNGLGTVLQGALETSNVNVVEELVSMIETQRAYEMNSKAISASDSMLQFLNTRT